MPKDSFEDKLLGLLDQNHPCASDECGEEHVRIQDKFCSTCGASNPNFSEEAYTQEMGKSSEEWEKDNDCEDAHTVMQRESLEDKEFFQRHPFCGMCGKEIKTLE